jgi:NAD+ synthase
LIPGRILRILGAMEATSKDGQGLQLNGKYVRKLLVDFIRDEIRNAGMERAVVGLSGGVDSSVVAYLSTEALGKENVLNALMPYKTSSPDSIEDAKLVIKELGTRSELVDITGMVDAYIGRKSRLSNVRKGNVMARARMIVLYDLSVRENALVVGTSNKTEFMLGYGTIYGDMACGINPLGDLYKSQVWQLAEEIGVPEHIVKKRPTADLWVGQTDEGELGFTYSEVDNLLYHMIDERRTDGELIQLGFSKNFVSKVRILVQRNQFKRRPPTIAKVSHRTVNVDFRYARDWGI